MGWSWAFLAVSSVGALLVLNAFRPARLGIVVVQSFFAGWYTAEMPLWHIVWQVAATVVFAVEGAFGYWPGWLGLGIAVGSWVGLAAHSVIANGAHEVLARAEAAGALPHVVGVDLPRTGRDTMWHFPRLIWPLPKPTTVARAYRNIDYWGDGRRAHRLDVVVGKDAHPSGAPVFLYIHGGAWIIGNKREQGFPMIYELARRGWVCVTINYRLSPRATWPAHIVDCKRALAWVRDHIDEYGGDPDFVAVSGGSAGGHLAALLSLTEGDPEFQPGFEEADTSVQAAAPIYGQYDLTCHEGGRTLRDKGELRMFEKRIFKTTFAEHPEVFRAASPLYRVRPDAPPFFIIHGRNDTLIPVEDARNFYDRLLRVSTSPVLYAELPFTQHAFDVLPSVRSAHMVAAVVRFFEAIRQGARADAPAAPDVSANGAVHSEEPVASS